MLPSAGATAATPVVVCAGVDVGLGVGLCSGLGVGAEVTGGGALRVAVVVG